VRPRSCPAVPPSCKPDSERIVNDVPESHQGYTSDHRPTDHPPTASSFCFARKESLSWLPLPDFDTKLGNLDALTSDYQTV
jgi:hypothetical protein